jgi:DNA-binding PadR family transcriptional regulator
MRQLSKTALVILGLLALRPRSGYEIKTAVDGSTRFFWSASYGQIYPELKRLERAGLIEREPRAPASRQRNVFRLTEPGRQAVLEWLAEPLFTWELRDEGLLKLFFADLLPEDDALELVRRRRRAHEGFLERLRQIRPGPGPIGGTAAYPDVVLDYGIAWNEWAIEWCRRTERRLVRKRRQRTA